jgi:hypothetical protein
MIEGWLKFLYLMLCLMLVAYSPLYADCIDGDCVDGNEKNYQGNLRTPVLTDMEP